jgi:putative ABC transport system ATP-binding protein
VAGLLDTFDAGTYLLDGKDVSRLSDREMSRIRNRTIGFIFQSFNLIPDLNVFDNVDVPLRYRGLGAAERKQRIERALEMVGLSARTRHLPSQLSGGQQQRVAIARVLAGDPKLILADEPTGNLDSVMTREIMDLLERINESGTTIVMVTHSPECAERAHRQLHVFDGRVVDLERPRVTLTQKTVSAHVS